DFTRGSSARCAVVGSGASAGNVEFWTGSLGRREKRSGGLRAIHLKSYYFETRSGATRDPADVVGDCRCGPQFGSISRPVRVRPSEIQQLHAKLSCTEWSRRRANRGTGA